MDSRWFLAGAVVGLLILLFDKPLAGAVEQNIPFIAPAVPTNQAQKILAPNSTNVVNQVSCCPSYSAVTAAPLSPATSIIRPSHSLPVIARVFVAGSPAPVPVTPKSITPTNVQVVS